jgi:NADH dehydrogenase FAD-containing subunit
LSDPFASATGGIREDIIMGMKKRIVVVGGGVAGSTIAKNFDLEADVTLIDPKDYFEVPYAALRCTVEPTFAERSCIKHSEYLKKAKLVQSSAQSVSDSAVVTVSGDKIPYDFLVVCTGSTYTGPATKAERIKEYQADNKKLEAADSVLIIGGGPVGVELAGEIVVDFPTIKVSQVKVSQSVIRVEINTEVSAHLFKEINNW